jgi:phenol hydroxylase P4 protein
MAVAAIGEYKFPPSDRAEVYGDNQIVYFCWDRHLLFAAPSITFVPKDMTLGAYLDEVVAPLLGPDPDFGQLEWAKAQWSVGPNAFTPDFCATLIANGIGHKDKIIMSTPGLNSLMPDS